MRQRKEPVMVKLFDVPKIPKTSLKRLLFSKAKKARKKKKNQIRNLNSKSDENYYLFEFRFHSCLNLALHY